MRESHQTLAAATLRQALYLCAHDASSVSARGQQQEGGHLEHELHFMLPVFKANPCTMMLSLGSSWTLYRRRPTPVSFVDSHVSTTHTVVALTWERAVAMVL